MVKSESHDGGLVKVMFRLSPDEWHGSAAETLWATPVGPDSYRLENTPFYAFGVSFQDVVVATSENSVFVFSGVFKHGGHSTYRIIVDPNRKDDFEEFWEPLHEKRCTYEAGPGGLLAVDVPPEANIRDVYGCLQAGEDAGVWGFEEGHCGHLVE
ncbi:hypothetical protein SOCE26_096280 [Sorangium cellulosum]|uniref:DUF4265 domain-containing protein n=1 Tax=Sorangium cellulosum TaxID=56 RepID=A0A2L0F936_SORCE|nr:DUF4265 domain-containing protein [Sorangium cellulosum]AUX48098.1 hypothetical protein SOCE26_096280 [Sorangium cellulosum]